jgi:hypothetical protein
MLVMFVNMELVCVVRLWSADLGSQVTDLAGFDDVVYGAGFKSGNFLRGLIDGGRPGRTDRRPLTPGPMAPAPPSQGFVGALFPSVKSINSSSFAPRFEEFPA